MHKGRRKRENLRVLKLASNLTWLAGLVWADLLGSQNTVEGEVL
jgi:hypothetical protein